MAIWVAIPRRSCVAQLRVPGIDFRLGRLDQAVEQVICFHAEAFASRNLDVGPGLVLFGKLVAEFGGAARRERDHLVGKVRVVIGGLIVSKTAQRLDDRALGLGLARVDHVIDLCHVAKVGMVRLAFAGRDPYLMLVRIAIELAITEVASQQAELPHVVGNVFANVADGAIGADDDFLVFFGNVIARLVGLRTLCALAAPF